MKSTYEFPLRVLVYSNEGTINEEPYRECGKFPTTAPIVDFIRDWRFQTDNYVIGKNLPERYTDFMMILREIEKVTSRANLKSNGKLTITIEYEE